ncbi:hypothetical protein [Streptomyces sp. NPDC057302]|uniref:hypothetical protein n=1 Tax=Streptomyces sp. NPDC057302 TaxID=3346094 RepID=UPI00363845EA
MTRGETQASDLVEGLGPFWESGTFWAAAAAVVAVVAVYVTHRAAHPRRRLMYAFTSDPLVQRHQREMSTRVLRVSLGDQELSDPRLVTLRLECRGTRDISSAQFENGKPIEVVLGVPILELVSMSTEPPDVHPTTFDVVDGVLRIGPGRLGAGETVSYTVLVDGAPDQYTLRRELIDVRVRPKWRVDRDGYLVDDVPRP